MNSPVEYSAIKSGIIALSLACEKYRQKNIRVNCISMGESRMKVFLDFIRNRVTVKDARFRRYSWSLLYLLSERSQFVTGQNLVIDDGWSLKIFLQIIFRYFKS